METDVTILDRLLCCASPYRELVGPDYQVRDLRAFLRTAFELLRPDQRQAFWQHETVKTILHAAPKYGELADELYNGNH